MSLYNKLSERVIVYHEFYRLLSLYFVIALACKLLKMYLFSIESTNASYFSLGYLNARPSASGLRLGIFTGE